jgi:transcriptional regulator NrdR family protein
MSEANDKPAGFRCPGCNCAELRIVRTMKVPRGVRRYRKCRYCGRRMTTYEVTPRDVRPA